MPAWGTPWEEGTPLGYPPRRGYPPQGTIQQTGTQVRYPTPGRGHLPRSTPTEQHSEYLLRGGRYASCVHAGGLSCFPYLLSQRIITLERILLNQPINYSSAPTSLQLIQKNGGCADIANFEILENSICIR